MFLVLKNRIKHFLIIFKLLFLYINIKFHFYNLEKNNIQKRKGQTIYHFFIWDSNKLLIIANELYIVCSFCFFMYKEKESKNIDKILFRKSIIINPINHKKNSS